MWVNDVPIALTGEGLAGELAQTSGEVVFEKAIMEVYFTTPGNKTVTATANGYRSATYTVTVNKGDPATADYTIPTGHIYNGSPQGIGSITQTANGITGFGTVTVYYDGSTTAPTNAGTYTVTADFAGGDNFNAATGAPLGTYTIDPKDITVTALGGSSTFGESPTNPGFTADGLVNSETVSVLAGLSNDFNITSTTPGGTYTLNVTGTLTNTNYNITQRNTDTWKVNQVPVVIHYHTLTLSIGEGIITDKTKNTFEIESGNPFSFVITLKEGYEGQTPTVTVNGRTKGLILVGTDKWRCILSEIYEDTHVSVSFNPTGIDTPDGPRLYSRDGQLFIESGIPVNLTVYAITGQTLVNRRLTEGLTAIPLPNGMYIVKLDKEVQKISIRE